VKNDNGQNPETNTTYELLLLTIFSQTIFSCQRSISAKRNA
jgi:hypothetical protein